MNSKRSAHETRPGVRDSPEGMLRIEDDDEDGERHHVALEDFDGLNAQAGIEPARSFPNPGF
jgi:hypothetical protein